MRDRPSSFLSHVFKFRIPDLNMYLLTLFINPMVKVTKNFLRHFLSDFKVHRCTGVHIYFHLRTLTHTKIFIRLLGMEFPVLVTFILFSPRIFYCGNNF